MCNRRVTEGFSFFNKSGYLWATVAKLGAGGATQKFAMSCSDLSCSPCNLFVPLQCTMDTQNFCLGILLFRKISSIWKQLLSCCSAGLPAKCRESTQGSTQPRWPRWGSSRGRPSKKSRSTSQGPKNPYRFLIQLPSFCEVFHHFVHFCHCNCHPFNFSKFF